MFTFSRSTKTKTVLAALLALAATLFSASAASASSTRISPTKRTLVVGQVVHGVAAGRNCKMRLPSKKVLRVNGHRHWSWRANRAGRFSARIRCGHTIRVSQITVKRVRHTVTPISNPNDDTDAPEEPQIQPNASMTLSQLLGIYNQVCPSNLKAKICLDTIGFMAPKYSDTAMANCDWYHNCDPVKWPHGNPYDTSNGHGVCADWAYYKRPDIKEKVEMYAYKQWALDGMPKADWQGGSYTSPNWASALWSKSSAWTTWAVKAGFKVDRTPAPGAIMVENGHAAYVESLTAPNATEIKYGYTDGGFKISEMNANGARGVVHYATYDASAQSIKDMQVWFIH